jgi:hypothetical protein
MDRSIELTVDGCECEIRSLQLHAHERNGPPQHQYVLIFRNANLAQAILERFPEQGELTLTARQTSWLFNILRIYIPPECKYGESKYWANTADHMIINGDIVEIMGGCSAHVDSFERAKTQS